MIQPNLTSLPYCSTPGIQVKYHGTEAVTHFIMLDLINTFLTHDLAHSNILRWSLSAYTAYL